jgi:hypothetical protein
MRAEEPKTAASSDAHETHPMQGLMPLAARKPRQEAHEDKGRVGET